MPVLKLATFCEAIAPGLLNICRRFGGTCGIQLYDSLRMDAAGVLRNPLPLLHGTGAVKPFFFKKKKKKKKKKKSSVKRKKF